MEMNYKSCAICHKAKTPLCNHCTLFGKFEKAIWAEDFESEIRADEREKAFKEFTDSYQEFQKASPDETCFKELEECDGVCADCFKKWINKKHIITKEQ